MKLKILFFLLFFQSYTFCQDTPDSLKMAIDNLNQTLLSEVKGFEENGEDYLVLRINDSLTGLNNSYIAHHFDDSCSYSYQRSFNAYQGDEYSAKYEIHTGHIMFRNEKRDECSNRLAFIAREVKQGYLEAHEPKVLTLSDLERCTYLLYGKIGDQYIIEEFNHEFVSAFHSGMVYNLLGKLFGNVLR